MDTMDGEVQRLATQRVWSEDEGQCIVAAWRRSGESPAAFARRYGIAVHRLYYRITTATRAATHCGRAGRVILHDGHRHTPHAHREMRTAKYAPRPLLQFNCYDSTARPPSGDAHRHAPYGRGREHAALQSAASPARRLRVR